MPPGMDPPDLLAVVGSVTPPGRLRRAVADGLERSVRPTDLLDLAEVRLPFADGSDPDAVTAEVITRVTVARSVLLATPVYRGSLTGVLKNLLDLLPVEALEGKPVAILAMGATPRHFLGAERHLRDVLAFFGAHVVPVAGYLTSRDFADGVPSVEAAEEVDRLVAEVLGLRVALRPMV
ncbi:MAG TPA: NADPH-dependent FMN reductase [Thermoleophilaceae bacterium]|nr:NADPH-dependent FMN reductase [Thermoleophilaceae bacterium]